VILLDTYVLIGLASCGGADDGRLRNADRRFSRQPSLPLRGIMKIWRSM
jgi:hypothetical protein